MRLSIGLSLLVCGLLAVGLGGCGSAKRALVHEEDVAKVFPWPNNKKQVTIRVKPESFWVNTCSLLGSYEEVQVNPDTTFYLVDELDKKFAYTPSRSPIRRLAPVESMEIRWPVKVEAAEQEQAADPAEQPQSKPAPGGKPAGGQGEAPKAGGGKPESKPESKPKADP
jgi:hypothetical protein